MVHAPEAERAWNLAKSRPTEAIELARTLLHRLDADDPDRAIALAARGRARFELGDNDEAIADLRRATDSARGSIRSRSLIALSAAVAAGGDKQAAAEMLEAVLSARDDAGHEEGNGDGSGDDPTIWAMALSQLGLLRMHDGDMTGAADLLERSTGPLRDDPNEHDALARVLGNAGYCQLVLGDLERALDLFDEAVRLGQLTDQRMLVAGCLQNKACVLALLGEFPEALAQLHRALEEYDAIGGADRNLSTLYDDMADTYRLAGLTRDAVGYAQMALGSVEGRGNAEKEADARYRLAVCLLDDGDHRRAIDMAKRANALFGAAGRSLWQTRATLVAVEAATADRLTATEEQVERIDRATVELERAGWRTEALRLRNRMLLMGLASDDPGQVDRFLLDGRPVHDQSVLGHLEALLHEAVADYHQGGRADRSLAEATSILQAHRRRLTDPELRAGSGRLAQAFRFIALAQEMAGDDPARILETEEEWRAASLRLPRARPSTDPAVAETTRLLREATRRAADAAEPDPDLDRRVRQLEERLRQASHQVTATVGPLEPRRSPNRTDGAGIVERLCERLGDRRLVEWFEHRDRLYAVDVAAGRAEIRDVGPLADLRSAANRLRRDLARQLHAPTAGQPDRRWRRIGELSHDLGRRLFGPLGDHPGLVLSPPGALQELPWTLLTPRPGTPLAITFSASSWLVTNEPIAEPSVHAIVGPDLQHGADDHRAALTHFGAAAIVAGGDRAAMERAVSRADLLHVAAHGRFRADNPMFSSLRLTDGEFALHELADFDRVPAVVALAACDAGRSQHLEHGAEQLGTAAAWLSAGVETVVAPICAVPDQATAIVFEHFYAALPGRTPADALALTASDLADAPPDVVGTAAAFLCFGTGGPRLGRPGDPMATGGQRSR